MTIQEFLAEQGLTSEEIQAVVGNPAQAKAMTAALSRYDEGRQALSSAQAEKQETAQFWEQKTQELQGSVQRLTAAERRAAQAEADAARIKAYNKSLADQGYDVPKEMYEGASSTTTNTPPATDSHGNYITRDDLDRMARATAPDLIQLQAVSNEYSDLYGKPYIDIQRDFEEASKAGKPFSQYARSKYAFDTKRQEKMQSAEQARIDAIVNEKMKVKETELAAKYGSNPNLSMPMPSKFDRLAKREGFKSDSWKSSEGRAANREERLRKFENSTLQ